uniref:Notch C-terminal domain-containing protein n=1 Tax=Scleropages formosus TaxID=113540 RepID=A0A8C9RSL8_SCLFO
MRSSCSSLRDIMKPKEGAVVHTDEEQAWLQPKKPKMEEKTLLPNGSDSRGAGDDPRDWTPQHWKAADLALMPPQAQMEVDCLDVNVRGPDGLTPLMLASLRQGASPDCDSSLGAELEEGGGAQEPGPDIISDLVALGAMLQARTEATGETALHLAARFSRADATKRLLDAGADANARDHAGRTPLHTAVAADAQGVFQILIRNRATDLNARMNDGTTATILATRLAVEGMVQQLVHCHADVNAVDNHGKSALHWAAAVNNVEAALVLVKNGANRDLQNNKEETPLFLAAREGSFDVARILLDHCCSREIADHLDRLPRDIARERMHHDIVQLLDHYNLAPSPHVEHDRLAGDPPHAPRHAPLGCSNVLSNLRPGPQAKKSRRGGGGRAAGERPGKEAKDPKAKRRKRTAEAAPGGKPGGGSAPAGEGLSGEGSGTLSPPDSLESPHAFAADGAAGSQSVTSPLPLATPRINRPLLPPFSQVLVRQQQVCWTKQGAHGYRPRPAGILPRHFGVSQPAVAQCYQESHLAPMPPALAYQMMAREMDRGQEEVLYHPQQGTSIPQCISARTFPLSTLGGADESPLTCSLGLGGTALCPSLHRHEGRVEKYPELVSQCSYPSGRLEGAAPSVRPRPPAEHPYLTPSPESLDPWSCSSSPSSHSNSDWSEVTASPVCHAHMPNPPHPQQPPHSSMHTHS